LQQNVIAYIEKGVVRLYLKIMAIPLKNVEGWGVFVEKTYRDV